MDLLPMRRKVSFAFAFAVGCVFVEGGREGGTWLKV